jgi:hypothetical protein
VVTETSLNNVAPNLKLEFKGDDKSKGDLGFIYKVPSVTFTGEIDLVNFSSTKGSVNSRYGSFLIGGNYELGLPSQESKFQINDYSAGLGYSLDKSLFVGLRANKKLSDFGLLFSYDAVKNLTVAGSLSYPKNAVSFGGIYKCNPATTIKAKFLSEGKVAASVKQSLEKNASVTAAAEVDLKNLSGFKFGVVASLG